MAIYFKRRLANEILRFAQTSNLTELEAHRLERKLCQIFRVRPSRQGSITQPSLSLNVGELKSALPQASLLKELQQWLKTQPQSSNGNYHFQLDKNSFIQNVLTSVRSEQQQYGYVEAQGLAQRICVEFSSPNVAKPFHVGHLRSTIIGNVVSNMYEAAGHDVKRINFLGDWGTQFGLLTLGLKKYSDEGKLTGTQPLKEILKAYVQINQDVAQESGSGNAMTSPTYQDGIELFARLEKGDSDLQCVWSQLRTLTLTELDKMYQRLGVTFTHTQYESDFRDSTQDILTRLTQAGLLEYGENGVGYVPVDEAGHKGRASVVKSDGASLYLTRDVAAALHRHDSFCPDRMHYVVEMGQRGHFSKLTSILKQLGVPWAQRPLDEIHLRFGRIQGMSTRKGNSVHLDDVLDEARSKVTQSMQSKESTRVRDNVEQVADRLAVSSVILQDLKSQRSKDYVFSWEKMLNFKADSGVFVQYCHARLCSMMANCGVAIVDEVDIQAVAKEQEMVKLVIHLARYPDVFNQSLATSEPHHIVQYLFQLCHLVNSAYAVCPVKWDGTDVAQARVLVFECSRQVLANCLHILGISPLAEI